MARIAQLQARVTADPSDEEAHRDLGLVLLQRIRETADPSLYDPAEAELGKARALAPDDALVLVGLGGLQLGRHRFADALETGRQAVALAPNQSSAEAVVVDALVELGRYREADAAAGRMLAVSADLPTLTRTSYVRELHGDLPAALAAIRLATQSPGIAPENSAFVLSLLGNLLVWTGDATGARRAYEQALEIVPLHAPSIAGLARLAVGSGDLAEAVTRFERASAIIPLPEYVIALGEAQEASGDTGEAKGSYALARAEIQLFQANGVAVDLDLALFEADHGDTRLALEHATAAYAATPTVRAADALAWALHRLGRDREAAARSNEALRLGARDPLFHYHAGAIDAALGRVGDARRHLSLALRTDPGFSPLGVAEARRLLSTLG